MVYKREWRETDVREWKKVCKVCGSDRRTVTHLMKEYVVGSNEKEKKGGKGVGHTENDELDWTEKVMRKREREREKGRRVKKETMRSLYATRIGQRVPGGGGWLWRAVKWPSQRDRNRGRREKAAARASE